MRRSWSRTGPWWGLFRFHEMIFGHDSLDGPDEIVSMGHCWPAVESQASELSLETHHSYLLEYISASA